MDLFDASSGSIIPCISLCRLHFFFLITVNAMMFGGAVYTVTSAL